VGGRPFSGERIRGVPHFQPGERKYLHFRELEALCGLEDA
jgi:hypothetical protein